MAKRWTIAGGALLFFALLWFIRGARPVPRAPRPVPQAPASAPERPSSTPLAEVEPDAVRTPAGRPDAVTEELLEVRVVAGPARAPVADAEVFRIDEEMQRYWPLRGDPFAVVPFGVVAAEELHGRHHRTDTDGRVHLALPLGPCVVAARSGTSFASRELDVGEVGPVVLALEPDPPVRVRVVDRGGTPVAGVPVALRYAPFSQELTRAITRADGVAELYPRGYRSAPLRLELRAGLALLLSAPVEVPLDLERVPPQPIVLVLPDTGAVDVTLLDERGEPWSGTARVWLAARVLVPTAANEAVEDERVAELEARAGRARFAHVGLGLELRVGAEPLEREETSVALAGPRASAERVDVRLAVGRPEPVLSGRILDPAREPIAGARLQLEARAEHAGRGVGCTTDPAGRFRRAFSRGGFDLRETRQLRLVARTPGGAAYHGSIEQPRLGDGLTELGDVVLSRSPLIVSGTVVDEEEKPVRRARVSFLLGATPGQWYSGRVVQTTLTDALGRFAWSAQLEQEPIGVRVEKPGFANPDTQVVPAGSEGLRFVLVSGGWLTGRISFTPSLLPTLELFHDGERVNATLSLGGSEERGHFSLGPLPAGTYSLSCGYPWWAERLWVDRLVIVAGSRSTDPRLDPLDLRAFVPTLGLEIVDREGASVRDAVILLRSGSGELMNVHARQEGERWLVQGSPLPLRIRVEAPGFRPQELDGVDAERRVVLERGIAVQLSLLGALPELPEGWELRAQLTRQSFGAPPAGRERSALFPEQSFGFDAGVAEPWLSEPGNYLFAFVVVRASGMQRASFWDEPQPVLEIADDGTLQSFELRAPSQATVQEMLDFTAE